MCFVRGTSFRCERGPSIDSIRACDVRARGHQKRFRRTAKPSPVEVRSATIRPFSDRSHEKARVNIAARKRAQPNTVLGEPRDQPSKACLDGCLTRAAEIGPIGCAASRIHVCLCSSGISAREGFRCSIAPAVHSLTSGPSAPQVHASVVVTAGCSTAAGPGALGSSINAKLETVWCIRIKVCIIVVVACLVTSVSS
jgi:hypothetical protein